MSRDTVFNQCASVADARFSDLASGLRMMVPLVLEKQYGTVQTGLVEWCIDGLWRREKLGSTAWGKGVATPHFKTHRVNTICCGWFLCPSGCDFNALDRQLVHIIFLMILPEDCPEEQLHCLEVVFRHLSNERFRSQIRQSGTNEALRKFLRAYADDAKSPRADNDR